MKSRSTSLLARCALVLVLVAGQLAAQSHLYSHLRFIPELSEHGGIETAFCNDCLAFAPLLSPGGAPQALSLPVAPLATILLAATPASLPAARLSLGFRSRAPPRLS